MWFFSPYYYRVLKTQNAANPIDINRLHLIVVLAQNLLLKRTGRQTQRKGDENGLYKKNTKIGGGKHQ